MKKEQLKLFLTNQVFTLALALSSSHYVILQSVNFSSSPLHPILTLHSCCPLALRHCRPSNCSLQLAPCHLILFPYIKLVPVAFLALRPCRPSNCSLQLAPWPSDPIPHTKPTFHSGRLLGILLLLSSPSSIYGSVGLPVIYYHLPYQLTSHPSSQYHTMGRKTKKIVPKPKAKTRAQSLVVTLPTRKRKAPSLRGEIKMYIVWFATDFEPL